MLRCELQKRRGDVAGGDVWLGSVVGRLHTEPGEARGSKLPRSLRDFRDIVAQAGELPDRQVAIGATRSAAAADELEENLQVRRSMRDGSDRHRVDVPKGGVGDRPAGGHVRGPSGTVWVTLSGARP